MAEILTDNVALGMLYYGDTDYEDDPYGFRLAEITNALRNPLDRPFEFLFSGSMPNSVNGFVVVDAGQATGTEFYSFDNGVDNISGNDTGVRLNSYGDFMFITDTYGNDCSANYGGGGYLLRSFARIWYPRYNFVAGTKFTVVDSGRLRNFSGFDFYFKGPRFRRVTLSFTSLNIEDFKELWSLLYTAGKRYLCYLSLHPHIINGIPREGLHEKYSGLGFISNWSDLTKVEDGYSISLSFDLINIPNRTNVKSIFVFASMGTIEYSGVQPTSFIQIPVNVAMATGQITYVGEAYTVDQEESKQIDIPVGNLSYDAQAITVDKEENINSNVPQASLSYTANSLNSIEAEPGTLLITPASLSYIGYAPTVTVITGTAIESIGNMAISAKDMTYSIT